MFTSVTQQSLFANSLHWLARILGALLFLLVITFAIGEGLPNPLKLTRMELLQSAALLTMLIGIVAAWNWEGIGGTLILGGFALFWAVNFFSTHQLWISWPFVLFLLTGFLHLFSWWETRRKALEYPG